MFAMAPKQTKKDEQNKQPNDKKENFIMKYRLWAKSALAPYPAEDGSPLYTGDLEAAEYIYIYDYICTIKIYNLYNL